LGKGDDYLVEQVFADGGIREEGVQDGQVRCINRRQVQPLGVEVKIRWHGHQEMEKVAKSRRLIVPVFAGGVLVEEIIIAARWID
jgi:hypothetical protein